MRARLQRLSRALSAILFAIAAHSCTGSSSINVTSPSGAPKCQVAVTNSMTSAPAAGASGAFTVTTTRDCTWSAFSSAQWVTLTANTSGQGEGSIGYTVAPNADPAPRHANVQVNDVSMVVTQEAAPCRFVVTAPNTAVSASGGPIAVAVGTKTGCSWTAASQADWITIANGKSGNGPGTVTLAVAANLAAAARTGVAVVAGEAVTISQAPAPPPEPAPAPTPTPTPCTYALGSSGVSIAAAGGSYGVSVTADSGCTWTAASNASWLTITSSASGSANGSVTFSASANTGAARSGTLTIAGQVFTVSQGGQ